MKNDKVETQWLAIVAYSTEGEPSFAPEKVWASDRPSALIMFDLMCIDYMDVTRYLPNESIYDLE